MPNYIPILNFHSIDDERSTISFSPHKFQRGLSKLHERGYRTLSLQQATHCIHQKVPFPQDSLIITFDDGFKTVYDQAFPALRRNDMSATVFLTVGKNTVNHQSHRLPSHEGRPMLSWHEIREMQQQGIEFGAHTLTHPDLTRLPLEQVEVELSGSKRTIEDILGIEVGCFSYPHGRFSQSIYEIARNYFLCACSVKLDVVTLNSDLHALERIDAYYYLKKDWIFDLILTPFFPWYIRLRSIPPRIRHKPFARSD